MLDAEKFPAKKWINCFLPHYIHVQLYQSKSYRGLSCIGVWKEILALSFLRVFFVGGSGAQTTHWGTGGSRSIRTSEFLVIRCPVEITPFRIKREVHVVSGCAFKNQKFTRLYRHHVHHFSRLSKIVSRAVHAVLKIETDVFWFFPDPENIFCRWFDCLSSCFPF